jgi:hypothetical protein
MSVTATEKENITSSADCPISLESTGDSKALNMGTHDLVFTNKGTVTPIIRGFG